MTKRLALVAGLAASLALLYWGVLAKLVADWSADENYSHGFLVAPLAVWIAWRARAFEGVPSRAATWAGAAVVAASTMVLLAGLLGAELFLTRFALLATLAGSALVLGGSSSLRASAFALLLLFLTIPVPAILLNQVTFPLQLLASQFGEFVLSVLQIPVLREGNVIILANTTLEIAEACSGIRSLVSLLTLALVWGYFAGMSGRARALLVVAACPIAIAANGLRVAGTGVAAHYAGAAAAEGFLHTFSGWLVFVVACALLFPVQRLAAWLFKTPNGQTPRPFDAAPGSPRAPASNTFVVRAAILAACFLAAAVGVRAMARTEVGSLRHPLRDLPWSIGAWSGRDAGALDERTLDVLRVDEYVNRYYSAPGSPPVGVYVGYYRSQRQGQTMHSPLHCLPGSGWEPGTRERVALPAPGGMGQPGSTVEVNRLVIHKGLDRQVVVYWYQSPGRIVASEYWGKIYTVLDALRSNRSDGALVRVIVPIDGEGEGAEAVAANAATAFSARMVALVTECFGD
jgi:exosortase D (VPLPA-CTERM-specific)